MTRQAFSVFSTDLERSDRPAHENIFYFSENATWFAKHFFEKMRNLKKKSRENQKFLFFGDNFFLKNFFEKSQPNFLRRMILRRLPCFPAL